MKKYVIELKKIIYGYQFKNIDLDFWDCIYSKDLESDKNDK